MTKVAASVIEASLRQIRELDVGEFDRKQLADLLVAVRCLQAAGEGLVARIGRRADELARSGRSAPAAEFLLGDGAVTASTARADARRAELAERFPGQAPELHGGSVTADKLDALARATRDLSSEELERFPIERVSADARRLPADTFAAAVRRRVDALRDDGGLSTLEEQRARSEFRHWFDSRSGMGRFSGRLDAERYEALTSAVDRQVALLASAADQPTACDHHLAAEALTQLVSATGGESSRPSITVVVDHRTLANGRHDHTVARTGDGHPLPTESVARLCCDAVLRRVVHDDRGVPIDVGRRHRTATPAQWDAVRSVHATCAWPGCRLPLRWTQLHHIHEWERGGPTDLANLVPLCHRHHHRVHEGGWSIRLRGDRTVSISLPDGSTYPPRSAGPDP